MSTVTVQMSMQELAQLIESAVDSAMDRKLNKWLEAQKKLGQPKNFVWDDEGTVRPEVEAQLLRQLEKVANGERGVPFAEVHTQLGLDENGNSLQV